MRSLRFLRFVVPIALLAFSGVAFAQNHSEMQPAPAPKSDTLTTFDLMKSLAGEWAGRVTVNPPELQEYPAIHVSMRVTSRGNALVHEGQESGTPLDPTKYDHPVTMIYEDGDRLTLVHYCDAGNRPRMVARKSADGKTVEFDLVDLSGGNQYGHMNQAAFTILDANHHTEDWTYLMPGDKPVHAHFDLQRVK